LRKPATLEDLTKFFTDIFVYAQQKQWALDIISN
jgi:hypothetical protein